VKQMRYLTGCHTQGWQRRDSVSVWPPGGMLTATSPSLLEWLRRGDERAGQSPTYVVFELLLELPNAEKFVRA